MSLYFLPVDQPAKMATRYGLKSEHPDRRTKITYAETVVPLSWPRKTPSVCIRLSTTSIHHFIARLSNLPFDHRFCKQP